MTYSVLKVPLNPNQPTNRAQRSSSLPCECIRHWRRSTPVARRQDLLRGGTKLHKSFFLEHKMTRNNTLHKVHVAGTELPQLLSQNTNMFREAAAQRCCQTFCRSEVNRKQNKIVGSQGEGGHVPQCPTADDANDAVRISRPKTPRLPIVWCKTLTQLNHSGPTYIATLKAVFINCMLSFFFSRPMMYGQFLVA